MGGGFCRECGVSLKLRSEWTVSRRWGQRSHALVHSVILHDMVYVAHWSLQSQSSSVSEPGGPAPSLTAEVTGLPGQGCTA